MVVEITETLKKDGKGHSEVVLLGELQKILLKRSFRGSYIGGSYGDLA